MTISGAIVIASIIMVSCGQNNNKQKELELKERELALKEKEFYLDSLQKTSSNKTSTAKSTQTENKINNNTPQTVQNNLETDENIFIGKWEEDREGSMRTKIAKKGSGYYVESSWESDAIESGKFQLIDGSLVGKTSNQFYPNNYTKVSFKLSFDKKSLMYNSGGAGTTLHKVNKFSYE